MAHGCIRTRVKDPYVIFKTFFSLTGKKKILKNNNNNNNITQRAYCLLYNNYHGLATNNSQLGYYLNFIRTGGVYNTYKCNT